MNTKTFLHDLRRGLGSAIIELQENPDRDKYRSIVLRCCLKNIADDVQMEGTKGYYLYTAICALGAKDDLEDIIISAFMKRLNYSLLQQLTDILWLFAEDGSEKARNALRAKYHSLLEYLARQRAFSNKFRERDQIEYLMICEINAGKWPAFKKCAVDAGRILMNRIDDEGNCFAWFFDCCRATLGKERVEQYFTKSSEESEEDKAFATAIIEVEKAHEKNMLMRVGTEISLENYVASSQKTDKDFYTHMTGLR
ncbi:MAG: hypothetical protein FWF04_04860, partial [Clostridiales bacterium]|nr:hypothetical protein [Clostridiales bacterium]